MSESPDNISSRSVKNRASDLKQRVQRDGRQRIESGKRAAADQIEEIADAIDVAGSKLDQSQPTLANYASKVAEGVGGLATHLRDDSIEDLYRDARRLAAEHPGMFLLGGAALGLAIARFMKAESDEDAGLSRMSSDISDSSEFTDAEELELGPETAMGRTDRYQPGAGPTAGV